jgi:hypothetical protein
MIFLSRQKKKIACCEFHVILFKRRFLMDKPFGMCQMITASEKSTRLAGPDRGQHYPKRDYVPLRGNTAIGNCRTTMGKTLFGFMGHKSSGQNKISI